jgi:hypothetical protein
MTPQQIIEVLQAWDSGKTIQRQVCAGGNWVSFCKAQEGSIAWDFSYYVWRVKPQPREWWVNVYGTHYSCLMPSKVYADSTDNGRIECIRVREVLE